MRSKKWKSTLVSFLLFSICCLPSTEVSALDVKRAVHSNGLTVLHVERHNLPIVIVTLLVKASPLDEAQEKAGLANLTAKLLTEGTNKRKTTEISDETEFIGASLGASVDSDFTAISLSVLKKDVEKGFDLLSDVVLDPIFPEIEISRLKGLIKGGLRQSEEDPSFVAERHFKAAVYGEQPYGRLTRGSTATLDRISREDITRFHSDFYRPGNSIIVVVGDLSEGELSSLIKRFFVGWKPSDHSRKPYEHKSDRTQKTALIDKDITQANIILGHEGIRREDPDYYAASVMNYILGGGGFSSRLMQIVRDEMGLAYSIHSYFSPNKYGGFFGVAVQTKNESANTVISEIIRQMKRISTEPVSEDELRDAKAYLTGSFPRRLETNTKIANFLAAIEFYNLGLNYIEKYPEYINAVTRDDILRAAKKYLDPDRYTLVVVANQSKAAIDIDKKR